MIRNGNGRLTNVEERLMLGNEGGSAASEYQGSSNQLELEIDHQVMTMDQTLKAHREADAKRRNAEKTKK